MFVTNNFEQAPFKMSVKKNPKNYTLWLNFPQPETSHGHCDIETESAHRANSVKTIQ